MAKLAKLSQAMRVLVADARRSGGKTPLIRVRSDAIARVGYHYGKRVLRIRFVRDNDKESKIYYFCRVKRYKFHGLLMSKSKGSYYDNYIRGKHTCPRYEDNDPDADGFPQVENPDF